MALCSLPVGNPGRAAPTRPFLASDAFRWPWDNPYINDNANVNAHANDNARSHINFTLARTSHRVLCSERARQQSVLRAVIWL
jgi:hypothetical protein